MNRNLYRSALAECLLRQRPAAARQPAQVGSAGTHAVPGRPMVAATASILVLGAAAERREAAVRLSPCGGLSRAFTLREFAGLLPPGCRGLRRGERRPGAESVGAARR